MSREQLRFALLGHPVRHSISPEIHGAAYAALGQAHQYELLDTPDEAAFAEALELLRSGYYTGLNVTVPWKRLALELADRSNPLAREIGAANVLVRHADGTVEAYNTDVLALREELARHCSAPNSVVVMGSGGAALAAVVAARELGAKRIGVVARGFVPGSPETSWPHAGEFRALSADVLAWPDSDATARDAWRARASESQIVIQATTAGMHGADSGSAIAEMVPWADLAQDSLAYDVVYNPPLTPFLKAAQAHGLKNEGGLGMLVGQAAHAFELWLNVSAPRARMADAAAAALARKASS